MLSMNLMQKLGDRKRLPMEDLAVISTSSDGFLTALKATTFHIQGAKCGSVSGSIH